MKFLVLFALLAMAAGPLEGQRRSQRPNLSYLVPTEPPTRPPTIRTTTRRTTTRRTTTPRPETDSGRKAVPEVHGHEDSTDPLDWLRAAIPGEPGVDYPIHATVPETSFACSPDDRGYFSDTEAGCQVWHQCFDGQMWSNICPNGTLFNQEILACMWWFDVDCSSSSNYLDVNKRLYVVEDN